MATVEQFQAAFDQINTATSNIADDIRRLTEQLATGLTPEQETEVLNKLNGVATALDAIAATTPE